MEWNRGLFFRQHCSVYWWLPWVQTCPAIPLESTQLSLRKSQATCELIAAEMRAHGHKCDWHQIWAVAEVLKMCKGAQDINWVSGVYHVTCLYGEELLWILVGHDSIKTCLAADPGMNPGLSNDMDLENCEQVPERVLAQGLSEARAAASQIATSTGLPVAKVLTSGPSCLLGVAACF